MYYLLHIFILMFPFLIFPRSMVYADPKLHFLVIITVLLWICFLFSKTRKEILAGRIYFRDCLLFIFLLLIGISTFFSVDFETSIYGMWGRNEGISALFSYGSLFFFSSRLISRDRVPAILNTISLGAVLVSIYAILQHFHLDILLDRNDSVDGFFDNPNFLGTYLVIALLITMSLYVQADTPFKVIGYYLANALLFLALIYSYTRSAWIGAFVGGSIFSFLVFKYRKHLINRCIFLLLLYLTIFIAINALENDRYIQKSSRVVNEVQQMISGEDIGTAGSSRWYIWRTAVPLIPKYFWIGSGPDTFDKVFPYHPEERKKYFSNPHIIIDKAHNEYLQMAITLGVPALIVYLGIVLSLLWTGFKRIRILSGSHQIYVFGLIAAILGYVAQAFFNISVVTVAPFYWVLLGGIHGVVTELKKEPIS